MKKYVLFSVFAIFLIAGCKSNSSDEAKKEETSSSTSESPDNSSPASDIVANADEAQKRVEELKKIQPISNESLKSFFADEVMGIKRSSFSVNSAMGYAIGEAEYRKDDNTKYRVVIYDCAGEAGSAFYSMSYLTRLNMEREDDNGYEKTTNFMNTKAIESYNKGSNTHTLNFVSGDRFWVSLEGQNTGLDNLKSFADALDLDKLKSLK